MKKAKQPRDRAGQHNLPEQCFVLHSLILDSLNQKDVEATYKDMKELNIAEGPFTNYDVLVPVQELRKKIELNPVGENEKADLTVKEGVAEILSHTSAVNVRVRGPKAVVALAGHFGGQVDLTHEIYSEAGPERLQALENASTKFADWIKMALIVCLASRNVEKTTKESKLHKFGIGKKKPKYRYTTTISLSKELIDAEKNASTGRRVRPHLRRGHIRRQHYGPDNEHVRKVWIAPVFVNADSDELLSRDHYNVRL